MRVRERSVVEWWVRDRKRKEGVEEARGANLQTKWVLFVDEKKKGRERERKTKKE